MQLPSFRRLRSLAPADWLAFLQAWLVLLAADLGLRLLSYPRVDRLFSPRRAARPASAQAAARAAWATRAAAHHHLWPMPCLPQSLCLRWLLVRCGLPARLQLGVARAGDGPLAAHAWVELDGKPVGEGEESVARFATLHGA